jgi:hypothetical protein
MPVALPSGTIGVRCNLADLGFPIFYINPTAAPGFETLISQEYEITAFGTIESAQTFGKFRRIRLSNLTEIPHMGRVNCVLVQDGEVSNEPSLGTCTIDRHVSTMV